VIAACIGRAIRRRAPGAADDEAIRPLVGGDAEAAEAGNQRRVRSLSLTPSSPAPRTLTSPP
jgi:hypothetical protein